MTTSVQDISYTENQITDHYSRLEVQDVINTFSRFNNSRKAGVAGDTGWYRYRGDKRKLLDLTRTIDYDKLGQMQDRRLLGTLNYFKKDVFKEWKNKKDISPGGFEETDYYMLSVDIDLTGMKTVTNSAIKKHLKTASEWLYNNLTNITNGKLLALFSGNGVYIHLHPEFAHVPKEISSDERTDAYDSLTKAFNLYLQELEEKLYEEHPDLYGIVKIDAINNRKRVFKVPLSLHKTLPYVVYPIDTDNGFEILLRELPLSDKDIFAAKKLINQFMGRIPTPDDKHLLITKLKQYQNEVNKEKRDYKDLDIKLPKEAIPIELIKQEPISEAIFMHDSWGKGNTRRVAFITSILRYNGWKPEDVKNYVLNIAEDWNVGSLSHVIDSWMDMCPPSTDTIYSQGNCYPHMNLGDLSIHLPDKPEYPHPLTEIHRLARNNGYDIGETINEPSNSEPSGMRLDLKYPTDHLRGFKQLMIATSLYGDEYKPIYKVLWYQLMSYRIRKSKLTMGQINTDGRVSALYVIRMGHGKGEIKKTIKRFVKHFEDLYGEPTHLHAEQLVGKIIKNAKKNNYEEKRGYLNDDFVCIDEAYNLLTSTESIYIESRKYIRIALDPYPHNTLHKRTTEFGRDAPLEYNPCCNISLFVQPKNYEDDFLFEEGDIRRFLVPYVNMAGLDKTKAYINRIRDNNNHEEALHDLCILIEKLPDFTEFTVSKDGLDEFEDLSIKLIQEGQLYSEKIRNFVDSIGFTIMNFLLKFSCIQAFQHGRNVVKPNDIKLAYLDLFEVLEHTYLFVSEKIPGMLNYGEGWQGADGKDQEVLMWLYQHGAIDLDSSTISAGDYQDKIKTVFDVKDRAASDIFKKHKKRGWVVKKNLFQDSRVWLNFKPGTDLQSSADPQPLTNHAEIIESQFYYYKLLKKYDKIVGTQNDLSLQDCSSMQTCGDSKTNVNIMGETTKSLKASQSKYGILNTISEPILYDWESETSINNFLLALKDVTGLSEYDELIGYINKLSDRGYVSYDSKNKLVKPTYKLIELFESSEIKMGYDPKACVET